MELHLANQRVHETQPVFYPKESTWYTFFSDACRGLPGGYVVYEIETDGDDENEIVVVVGFIEQSNENGRR
jgi:hypothetical protein